MDAPPATRKIASWHLLALGTFLYWGALPPIGFWPLAFLVPLVWTVLIEQREPLRFRTVYVWSFFFWIVSIWWIVCPHPLTTVGLFALAAYLAVYWPLFFTASRIAVHRFRVPVVLAAPICWVGCEWFRNHLLGGFSFCSLEHALYLKPKFIQIADLAGGYTVAGMITLVGSGFGIALSSALNSVDADPETSNSKRPKGLWSGLLAVTLLLASVGYGSRDVDAPGFGEPGPIRVAALQGNIPVLLNGDPKLVEDTLKQFVDLTTRVVREAREKGEPLDLIVWPETVCPIPLLEFVDGADPADFGWSTEQVEYWRNQRSELEHFVAQMRTPMLIGLSTLVFDRPPEPKRLNTALLIDPDEHGERPIDVNRYDKVQLVMFGEYIPFSEYLPSNFFLKTLCQEAGRGTGPVGLLSRDRRISVNICFESSVPHWIRNQIRTLRAKGEDPVLLVNMSNDGWFRFSRQIDQHLATHVFRAVENRRPYVTATNGGFAAIIDPHGNIRKIGARREAEAVVDLVPLRTPSETLYHRIGDTPAAVCALLTFALSILVFFRTKTDEKSGE